MAGSDRWYFTKDLLANTPSRKCGIDSDKELSYRQQAANLIQDMGQRLQVSQLCINTAIVYMHRFYTFHSFTKFHRNSISACALFLAAKVEEQPRKLEHVIKVSHMCLHRETPALDIKSEAYQEQAMELVFNENLMLQTLGFDIAVEHPHTSVVNCCQLVRASKDLAQTSYFMATNSLHLTTMCLQYKPTVVACVCIHLACKWSSWEIPRSSEGKDWFYYVDKSVTLDLLEQLTSEFLAILDKCPSRLKRKILSGSGGGSGANNSTNSNSLSIPKPIDEKKSLSNIKNELKPSMPSKTSTNESTLSSNASQLRRSPPTSPLLKKVKTEPQQSNKIPVAMSYAAYREKKDKERAHSQQDNSKQQSSEQLNKSNQLNKSLHQSSVRDISSQQLRDKVLNTDKISAKQQQINIDKQKQSDERHRIKAKNQDYLWETNSRSSNSSKSMPPSSSTQLKSSQNSITSEDFYDSLMNKPSNHMNFNSIFSTDNDDSSDFKKEITSDLKMEFSDNDSNQSTDGLNLNSFPSAFMNDSSDSKPSLPTSNSQTNPFDTKPSFMSIFSTSITQPNSTSSLQSKTENVKSIPSKYSDSLSVLSRIKPEPPPPMLSPLKTDSVLHESHSSLLSNANKLETLAQQYVKPIPNPDSDSKPLQNSKVLKTSPKSRPLFNQQKNFSALPQYSNSSLRDKEVADMAQNIKIEIPNNSQLDADINNFNIINTNNNSNNNTENTLTSIQLRQESREKTTKPTELPSVSKTLTTVSNVELESKPNVESLADHKSALRISPSPQLNINSVTVPLDTYVTKNILTHNKEAKEKHSHDKHSHKHHRDHHHSHKSSKHKDKHKHKHKDRDREKHKRKDKDRDKERDKEKHNDLKEMDPSFKISWSSPKDKTDDSINTNTAPIKLKISKKKLSVDSPDKDNDVPQNPLKLRIQLKDQKLTANTTPMTDSNSSSSRKRKSSPKSSKKEKISKHELEKSFGTTNSNINYDLNTSKTSNKSKKSNDSSKKNSNLLSDEKRSLNSNQPQNKSLNLQMNTFGQQMINTGSTAQTTQQQIQRSSKAHK